MDGPVLGLGMGAAAQMSPVTQWWQAVDRLDGGEGHVQVPLLRSGVSGLP